MKKSGKSNNSFIFAATSIYRSLFSLAAVLLLIFIVGCGNNDKQVVIYTSVDQPFAEPVLREFTARTGIEVKPVFDTEAAKTVGLANRLRAEAEAPKADVFWSSEFAHTMKLAREGLFTSYKPASTTDLLPQYFGENNLWTGFGLRARVLVTNTQKLPTASEPTSLDDLLSKNWKPEEVTVAYPMFGTTNTHAAALYALGGEKGLMNFFATLKENQAAFVDGNASTRDRVVAGASLVGLTDTDDALVAIKRGDPIKMIFPDQDKNGSGTLVIPNTVAILKNCPNPDNAKKFVDFITSAEGEKILIDKSEGFFSARNNAASQPDWIPEEGIKPLAVKFEEVAESVASAAEIINKHFLK